MIPSFTLGSAVALLTLIAAPATAKPAPCSDPQGYQWAVYPNPSGGNPIPHGKHGSNYPNFDPTVIKTMTPEENGVAANVGISGYPYYYIFPYGDYDEYNISSNNFIIDHRGYIKAPTTGFYNLTITADDDIVEFWLGQRAYSGWTRQNAVLTYAFYEKPPVPVSTTFKLNQGHYAPFRIIFGQAGGPYNLGVSLLDPNGNELLGSTSTLNSNIVQYSCKAHLAPPFPAYGSE